MSWAKVKVRKQKPLGENIQARMHTEAEVHIEVEAHNDAVACNVLQ